MPLPYASLSYVKGGMRPTHFPLRCEFQHDLLQAIASVIRQRGELYAKRFASAPADGPSRQTEGQLSVMQIHTEGDLTALSQRDSSHNLTALLGKVLYVAFPIAGPVVLLLAGIEHMQMERHPLRVTPIQDRPLSWFPARGQET